LPIVDKIFKTGKRSSKSGKENLFQKKKMKELKLLKNYKSIRPSLRG